MKPQNFFFAGTFYAVNEQIDLIRLGYVASGVNKA